MTVKQISVFAKNEPGSINSIFKIISKAGIEIRALTVADTSDFGIVRMITDDTEKTILLLTENHFVCSATDVIVAYISDEVGGAYSATNALYEGGVEVEYLYAFVTRKQTKACVVFRVDDNEKAIKLLTDAGIEVRNKF